MSKILVVDDELDMLKLIENVLKRDGHEVKVIRWMVLKYVKL